MGLNHLCTGAQHQMEGVAEDNLCPHPFQLFRGHRLDRTVGTYRHKGGGLDGPSVKGKLPSSG